MRRITGVLGLAALALVAPSGAVAKDGVDASRAAGPKIKELSFEHREDGSNRRFVLDAIVRRAERVQFKTRYAGEKAKGGSRRKTSIGGKPWRLEGGSGVVPLIRESLDARGTARVKVIARGDGRKEKQRFQIRLSECDMDPPFYPLTCFVEA